MAPRPIPEGAAYRAAWAALDRDTRRRITRAVNRMQALEDPREAALAVGFARTQQRFWRRGWLFGPVVAFLTQLNQGPVTVAANVVLAAALFLAMAWFFTRRARTAEQRNRAAIAARRRRGRGRKGRGR